MRIALIAAGLLVAAACAPIGPEFLRPDVELSPANDRQWLRDSQRFSVIVDFEARRSTFRSLLIVLPVAMRFLLSSASSAFVPVMIKVASMGQQATNDATRHAGRSLIMSTIIGGVGAVVGWQILRVFPSLTLYVLLIALAALLIGRKIFQGQGMHPDAATWSYAYLTMIVILAPAVMDSVGGASADVKFWDRMIMFGGTTVYSVGAVFVFDAFWRPASKQGDEPATVS